MSAETLRAPEHPRDQASDGAPGTRGSRVGRAAGVVAGSALSAAVSGWVLGAAITELSGARTPAWVVARAAGLASYLLLVALVVLGLVLAHPWRARLAWPSAPARLRAHVALAVFTLAFVVLHVVVLATDRWAGVGWAGVLLPMGSSYRPVPVTIGVIALWSGLLAGLTAALAGRVAGRVWWPIHKVAIVSLVLVWVHSLLAGSDAAALTGFYAASGIAVLALAVSRYLARTPAELAATDTRPTPRGAGQP